MRLILFLSLFSFSVIIAIVRPFFGLLVFSCLAYMRPQNLVWAASDDYRFSLFIALATLVGILFKYPREKFFAKAKENYLILALFLTFGVSTIFALHTELAIPKLIELSKILLIAVLTTGLVNTKKRFEYLCWLIVISLSFWGVKGAIWGIIKGWQLPGPAGSMIEDNNDFALALVMVLPFLLYLGIEEKKMIRKLFFFAQIPFIIIAIIYTFSRGGFLGLCVVTVIIILKMKRKFLSFFILGAVILILFAFTTTEYKNRIRTIQTYHQDASAMGRIFAWKAAWAMAKDRPLTGVGLRNFILVFPNYYPDEPRVTHNSYLQLLSESGFISLVIFLFLLRSCIMKLRHLRKSNVINNTNAWIFNYSHMLEVGLWGYIVSGFFLSRADFDLMYHFLGLSIALCAIAKSK